MLVEKSMPQKRLWIFCRDCKRKGEEGYTKN